MLDDRKLAVLRAIVTDYVSRREPVGSKALVDRHKLDVSSATVRNDMAALEEEGYITQPHTSAGRIPTDKGYRLFVDRLASVKPLSPAERRGISTFLSGALDMDDLVARTVRLLAQLTRQVAIVQYPVAQRAVIRHVDLVPITTEKMMVLVVNSAGRVEQAALEMGAVDESMVATIKGKLLEVTQGRTTVEATTALANLLGELAPDQRAAAAPIVAVLLELLGSGHASQVMVAGVPNLASFGSSFETDMRPLLEALEEQVVLLRLLGEATTGDDITIRIGQENTAEGFRTTSLVASPYGVGSDLSATLGIVGPTRMDYPSTIASVRAVARYVSRFLTEG